MNFKSVGVAPQIPSCVKINAVFILVFLALFIVPFKLHTDIVTILYKIATKYLNLGPYPTIGSHPWGHGVGGVGQGPGGPGEV